MKVHRKLAAVFEACERSGVRSCLLRVPAQPLAPSGDVDLLMDVADVGPAGRALRSLGFVRLPGWGYGSDRFYVGYDPSTEHWLWLHIATELTFGPYRTLRTRAEADCLARRRRDGGLAVLAPEDSFWALLLHCLLDKRSVAVHHRARLQELAPAVGQDSPLAATLAPLYPNDWDPVRLVDAVRRGEWAALESLAPVMQAACADQHPLSRQRVLAIRAARLAARAVNLLRPALWRRYRDRTRTRRLALASPGVQG
jgi:hypothetical protein